MCYDQGKNMIEYMYQYHKDLKNKGVYFSATGPFSHLLMEGIADILKKRMAHENITKTIRMRVFAVVVEQVQNIIRYSAEVIPGDTTGKEARIGTLVIGYEDDHFFSISGNLVENKNVAPLRERLTTLNNMTPSDLKRHYRESLKKERKPEARGAGLGFIEMLRKASKPIDFKFHPIDASVSFFSFKVTI